MNENRKMKFKIGEFSGLGRVTVRTLRHYEDIGLLEPDIVDRWTGYRYYSADQLQKLLAIGKLRALASRSLRYTISTKPTPIVPTHMP